MRYVVFVLLYVYSLFANDYESLNKFYNDILKEEKSTKENRISFDDFLVEECGSDLGIDINISDKVDLAKYNYYNDNLGIYFYSNGYYSDRDDYSYLTAGFAWKILKDGYKENKDKAEIVKLQSKIKKLQQQQVVDVFHYSNNYNYIIYFFNEKKIDLLEKYQNFLKLKYDIFKNKYLLHDSNMEKLFLIKKDIQSNENLFNEYKMFNNKVLCKGNLHGRAPIFDLRYDKLVEKIKEAQDENLTQIDLLKKQIIDKQYDRFDNYRFNIYADKDVYKSSRGSSTSRDILRNSGNNIGFSLRIPLFDDPDSLKEVKKLEVVSKNNEEVIKRLLYLNKNYYTYRYKLDDTIKILFKLSYVKSQMQRAILRHKFNIGRDNLDRIISNMDSIYNINLQILDIKQQLYLSSYSLLNNLNIKIDKKYVKELNIDTKLKIRDGNRALYIWANGFKKYSNNILKTLAKTKDIKTVLVSVSKYQDIDKLLNFIKVAKDADIDVEFLIGNNNWIYEKNRSNIDKKLIRTTCYERT